MSEPAVVLRCSGIEKSFVMRRDEQAQLQVLKGITLEIREGDFISIVGASGSGKSTLLHILGGLDRPTKGEVWWGENNIFSLHDDRLAELRAGYLGFVFQFHHLLPEFTALENVMIPQMIRRVSNSDAEGRARELLKKVNLEERLQQRPNELSGGEQQRVAVARALANRPKVILADEPSGNLDSENSESLHRLMLELNRTEGQTFVVVTHNDLFVEHSKHVFRMLDGTLHPADR